MTAVAGSGIKIMSDSLMPFQPAIDEPSNILPSLKKPSSTRRVGTVTCCSLPIVSVKRRSANLASFSLINLRTSAGIMCVLAKVVFLDLWTKDCSSPRTLQIVCQAGATPDQVLATPKGALCTRIRHSASFWRLNLVQSWHLDADPGPTCWARGAARAKSVHAPGGSA